MNITSLRGKVGVPHLLPHDAAKAAATVFSEGLGAEVREDGISVTTVLPGEMQTGSYRHAEFAGDRAAEFRWFRLGAALPTTISADRTASHIVRAIERRQAELIFPWTFSLALRAHGLAPGNTTNVLARVNALLPDADPGATGTRHGAEIEPEVRGSLWDAATAAGRRAAEELNEGPPANQNGLPPSPWDALTSEARA